MGQIATALSMVSGILTRIGLGKLSRREPLEPPCRARGHRLSGVDRLARRRRGGDRRVPRRRFGGRPHRRTHRRKARWRRWWGQGPPPRCRRRARRVGDRQRSRHVAGRAEELLLSDEHCLDAAAVEQVVYATSTVLTLRPSSRWLRRTWGASSRAATVVVTVSGRKLPSLISSSTAGIRARACARPT